MKTIVKLIAATCVLLMATASFAHHSYAPYDIKTPTKLPGKVESFRFIAPHPRLKLIDAEGVEWDIEVPIMFWRNNEIPEDAIKAGDDIIVTGFAARNGSPRMALAGFEVNGKYQAVHETINQRTAVEAANRIEAGEDLETVLADYPEPEPGTTGQGMGQRAGMGMGMGAGMGMAAAPAVAAVSTPADAPAGTYNIDKTHGYIIFSYLHQGYSKPLLRWRDWDSTLEWNPEDPSASVVSVTIKADSIDSGVDVFDDHLRGDRHFNVAEHPTITFTSTAASLGADNTGTLTGDLTMKGKTLPVSLDVTFNKTGVNARSGSQVFGFSGVTTVNRSEWDLGAAVPFVGDEVTINIEVEYNMKLPE